MPISDAVPDASLVVKWYTPDESGSKHAGRFQAAVERSDLHLAAREHLKVEVVRLLQLGVRDKRIALGDGLGLVEAFLDLPITHTSNDRLGTVVQLGDEHSPATRDITVSPKRAA
jgi:predicted nucleic acid-binding protein